MKECPNCGTSNGDNEVFCTCCGRKIGSLISRDRFVSRSILKFCTSCGTKLAEGVKFCENCGERVIESDTEINNENNNENDRVEQPVAQIQEKIVTLTEEYLTEENYLSEEAWEKINTECQKSKKTQIILPEGLLFFKNSYDDYSGIGEAENNGHEVSIKIPNSILGVEKRVVEYRENFIFPSRLKNTMIGSNCFDDKFNFYESEESPYTSRFSIYGESGSGYESRLYTTADYETALHLYKAYHNRTSECGDYYDHDIDYGICGFICDDSGFYFYIDGVDKFEVVSDKYGNLVLSDDNDICIFYGSLIKSKDDDQLINKFGIWTDASWEDASGEIRVKSGFDPRKLAIRNCEHSSHGNGCYSLCYNGEYFGWEDAGEQEIKRLSIWNGTELEDPDYYEEDNDDNDNGVIKRLKITVDGETYEVRFRAASDEQEDGKYTDYIAVIKHPEDFYFFVEPKSKNYEHFSCIFYEYSNDSWTENTEKYIKPYCDNGKEISSKKIKFNKTNGKSLVDEIKDMIIEANDSEKHEEEGVELFTKDCFEVYFGK